MSKSNKKTATPTPNPADVIAALEAQVAALTEKIEAAPKKRGSRVVKVAVPGTELEVSAKFVKQMETLITLGESSESAFESGDGFVVGPTEILAAGWSRCYSTITNGWTRKKTAGLAARVCGYRTRAKVMDGEVFVIFHKIAEQVEDITPNEGGDFENAAK